MIYGYHLDFKDEKMLQSTPHENVRGIISVVENDKMDISTLCPVVSEWLDASGTQIRYHSPVKFTKEHHDFSWGMEIKDVLTLYWSKETNTFMYKKAEGYRPDRLRFWLYHTVFPITLELQGIYHILHVGSVEIDGKPILFSAPSYGGKSTMTDYFIQQGHTMLCDDALGIEKIASEYYAVSSYPYHRPYRKVEELGYRVANFSTKSKPIHAVFVLNKLESEDVTVTIRELKGVEKFKAFHYSTFVTIDFLKEERFAFFADMAKKILMYEISYPHSMTRLPGVYQEITKHAI